MSLLRFCSKCGRELAPNGPDCPECQAPGTAPASLIEGATGSFSPPLARGDESETFLVPGADAGGATLTLVAFSGPDPLGPNALGARCEVFEEIARGGMGAVFKGRDPALGRELAVKVLLEKHNERPDLVRRFIEEAQIGGQLQHPGTVPVHELGAFPDGRPYFTMKLIQGRTLSELLRARGSPNEDLARFVGVFEQVCQTMAYAHARGVIHRDLKPQNVMVGEFGEVQVVDWGLAKVLNGDRGPSDGPLENGTPAPLLTDHVESRSGAVVGTPGHMAPEQARGESDQVDERTDVFGLGSVLCEVLTGLPAFGVRSTTERHQRAIAGDLSETWERLDRSGADPGLATICRNCLAPDRDDRPRDAKAVANAIAAHQAGVRERLKRAELEATKAQAKAEEEAKRAKIERQRGRLAVGMAISVTALVLLGAIGAAWFVQQRRERLATVERALAEVAALERRARESPHQEASAWREALAASEQALGAVGGLEDSTPVQKLKSLREELSIEVAQVERDAALVEALTEARSSIEDSGDVGRDRAYAEAFRSYAPDLGMDKAGPIAERLRPRPAPFVEEFVGALDDWSALRQRLQGPGRDSFPLALARALDAEPQRERLRSLLFMGAPATALEELKGLAQTELSPATASLLGSALRAAGAEELALEVRRQAAQRHPKDAWAHFDLAIAFNEATPPRRPKAFAHFLAARALRPETAHPLAHLLEANRQPKEAEGAFRDLVARRPSDASCLGCLGRLLAAQGRKDEARTFLVRAAAAHRDAISLDPQDVDACANLGTVLCALGELPWAVQSLREAIRLDPNDAKVHDHLGRALHEQRDLAGAVAAFRQALRLDPKLVKAQGHLGDALRDSGDFPGAITAYREALRLDPKFLQVHDDLALVLRASGDRAGAVRGLFEALRLVISPDEAVQWRQRALSWLREELTEQARSLATNDSEVRRRVVDRLGEWRTIEDFAPFREPWGLDALPDAERREWRAFWAEVDARASQGRLPDLPDDVFASDGAPAR